MAVMNLGLGYALAVVLSDAPLVSPDFFRRLQAAAFGKLAVPPEEPPAEPLPPATVEDLPAPWREQLTAAALAPDSFLEGLLLHLWLAIQPYREQLLTAEVRGRHALSRLDQTAESQLLADVRDMHHTWRDFQQEVLALLRSFARRLGDHERLALRLELILEHQIERLDRMGRELAHISIDKEPELGARQLLVQLSAAVDLLHDGRDQLQHLLATVLRGASSKTLPSEPLYFDATTGHISRVGLESLFQLWWKDDPQRLRLVSCALVDVDRFARLNDRLGHRAGDRILHAVADLLAAGIRSDRGFDRLARFAGQQFVVFFGDTGPRNAAQGMERIRQTFEAVTLDYGGTELDVSISAGVVTIGRDESLDDVLARLQLTLQDAKLHGRNRTSVDEGEGPQVVLEAARYAAKTNRVAIENS
jgi:diguanylate cyclase (GGDEF)-like protein